MTKYSVCITHYNNVDTVKDSLDSVLGQIDDSFEVVVVDNCSNDGSEKILKGYWAMGKIKLVTEKCSRGKGREMAFENSAGDYIVSHIDMDDIYKRSLRELIEFYHSRCEGKVMVAISSPGDWTQNVTIGPRDVIKRIGGWRDLQYADDWDLWSRAAMSSRYSWTVFPVSDRHRERRSRSGISRTFRFRFERYRDGMKLGRDVFKEGERVSLSQDLTKFLAKASLALFPSDLKKFNGNFRAADPVFFVS